MYTLLLATKQVLITTVAIMGFLCYTQFSLFSQLYLLAFTILCTYQMLIIAGKLGIAPLGRFATFVLLPDYYYLDTIIRRL